MIRPKMTDALSLRSPTGARVMDVGNRNPNTRPHMARVTPSYESGMIHDRFYLFGHLMHDLFFSVGI